MDSAGSDVKLEATDKRSSRESSRKNSFDAIFNAKVGRLEAEITGYRGQVEELKAENTEYKEQIVTLTEQVGQLEEQLRKAQEDHLKPESSTRSRSKSRIRRPFRYESDGGIEEESVKNLREEMKKEPEKLRHDIGEDVATKTFEKVAQVLREARQPRDPEEGAVEHAVGNVRKRTMWQYLRAANRWNDTTGNTIYSFASMVITFAGFYYLFHSPQSSSAPPMP